MYKSNLEQSILTFAIVMLFISCSKDLNNESNCLQKHTTYLDKTNTAAQKYGQNPTVDNCKAYKESIQEYINQTKGCTGTQTESLTQLLKELNCK